MKQGILLGVFMFFLTALMAQENCYNGVDDDGDGLVDLNDPECICDGIGAIVELDDAMTNPDFENFDCCPSSFSQMDCCTGWQTGTDATTDYMNSCGFILQGIIDAGLVPFPSGGGIVGGIYSDGWKEYLSTCLNTTLQAGYDFTLSFQLASAPINNNGTLCNGGIIDYGPVEVTLYGNTDCNSLYVPGTNCPASGGWVPIGTVTYNPVSAWSEVSITFTAPFDVNAFMIGAPCQLPGGYSGSPCYPYFVYDDMSLIGGGIITELTLTELGLPCDLDYGFFAEIDHIGGDWQWFFNGVAMNGETAQDFFVANNGWQSGTYQVVYSFEGECVMDSITVYIPPRDTVTEEVFYCPNSSVSCAGETFFNPGTYEVIIPLPSGCDSVVECVVTEYVLSPVTNIDIDTCGPVEIKVCGETFTETGEYYIYCIDWRGCDSIIVLNLRVLNPIAVIAPPALLECGPNADVVLDGSGSSINPLPTGSTTYQWLGPQDGFVGATDEPWAFVNKTATYCLVMTHENNGIICTDTACVTVQSAKATPEAPLLTGNFFGCVGDTSFINRMAVGTIQATSFDWIIPAGVPNLLALNDSTLRYIHSTPGSIPICARAVNECGNSDTTCIFLNTGLPTDTLINESTCDPSLAGLFTNQFTNQYGCDSTVTRVVALSPSNKTNLTATTCNPQMTGIDTLILSNQYGCDSMVILQTTLLPSNQVNLTFFTCDVAQAGLDTLNLFNQFGCDSTVYIERIYSGTYQETNTVTICGSGSNYIDTLTVTTGICDSLFLTAFVHLPLDTTWLTAETCDPSQVGSTVVLLPTSSGCDSAIITTVSLLPSDQTLVSGVTCDINDVVNTTLTLQNQFGCDSIVTISIQYVGVDTQYVQRTSCDPAQVGITTQTVPGINCDTIRVTTTTLLSSSQSQETITLCLNSGPARDTIYLQNVNGCDSIHIRNFEYTQLISELEINPEQCKGEANGVIVVTDMQGGTSPYEYRLGTGTWQSSTNFDGLAPGTYSLQIRDASGCADTLTGLVVAAGSTLAIDAGPDRVAEEGDIIDLTVQATQVLALTEWSATDPIACPTCFFTTLGPLTTKQTVTVTGQTAEGCSASDMFDILVRININVYIPNSFSPDNDGINDIFSVYGNKHVKGVRNLAIYDRWGNALYSRADLPINDPNEGWNGLFRDKMMDPGVYIYVVEVELLNGEIRLYKGDVTLVSKGKG